MAFYNVAFALITSTLMGMLLWSRLAAHGAGEFLALSTTRDGSKLSWHMLYGLQSFIGGWLGGVLGRSGWTSIPNMRTGHYLAKASRRR